MDVLLRVVQEAGLRVPSKHLDGVAVPTGAEQQLAVRRDVEVARVNAGQPVTQFL